MEFTCKHVAATARDGSTEFRGVEWGEARAGWEWIAESIGFKLLGIGSIVAVVGLISMIVGRSFAGLVPMLLGLLAAVVGLGGFVASQSLIPPRPRALRFHADGRVHAPLGLCNDGSRPLDVRADFAEIANIEAEQTDPKPDGCEVWYTHGVRLLTYDGDVLHVARRLEPDQAHMLAARLSAARERLRDELSGVHQPARHQVKVLLD